MTTHDSIQLYHGARRWVDPPQVRPHKKNRADWGPGLYLTTCAVTARKYGSLRSFHLCPTTRWSIDALVPYDTVLRWLLKVRYEYHIPSKVALVQHYLGERRRYTGGELDIPGESLVSFMEPLYTGKIGVALAEFFVENDIDGHYTQHGEITVLFNMKKILRNEPVSPRALSAPSFVWDLPTIPAQRVRALNGAKEQKK